MNITDIRIRKLMNEGRLRAVVSITLDNMIAIHDIKVIEGPNRLFVAMPSRREENGTFRDVVHPISASGRTYLEEAILDAYHQALEAQPEETGEEAADAE
ncbi:MAG: septation regulator SpoVG [Massiliimalia sp.]